MSEPGQEALSQRLEEVERSLSTLQNLLGRSIVSIVTTSYLALAVGREQAAVIEAAGTSPELGSLLGQVEAKMQALTAALAEAANDR